MGRIKDIVLGLDFESQPTHVIDFDPNVETETIRGREGDFEVIRVKENGKSFTLSLSNKTLLQQIINITKPCKLEVTRTGKSYDTKYAVKVVG